MSNGPFTAVERDNGKFYVRPVYVLSPSLKTMTEAEEMARMMNVAYLQGKADMKAELRALIGAQEAE